jgi:hypothetical protein
MVEKGWRVAGLVLVNHFNNFVPVRFYIINMLSNFGCSISLGVVICGIKNNNAPLMRSIFVRWKEPNLSAVPIGIGLEEFINRLWRVCINTAA